MHESGEDYIETIYLLKKRNGSVRSIDVAQELGFSRPSVSRAVSLLKENGYAVGNIDATIIAQKPKMAPHIPEMRENIAKALGIEISQLNIKATTEEGLGFTGQGEGISSQAICSLYRIGKLEEE